MKTNEWTLEVLAGFRGNSKDKHQQDSSTTWHQCHHLTTLLLVQQAVNHTHLTFLSFSLISIIKLISTAPQSSSADMEEPFSLVLSQDVHFLTETRFDDTALVYWETVWSTQSHDSGSFDDQTCVLSRSNHGDEEELMLLKTLRVLEKNSCINGCLDQQGSWDPLSDPTAQVWKVWPLLLIELQHQSLPM